MGGYQKPRRRWKVSLVDEIFELAPVYWSLYTELSYPPVGVRYRKAQPAIQVELEIRVLTVSTNLLLIELVEYLRQLWVGRGQVKKPDGRVPEGGWRGRPAISLQVLRKAGLRVGAVRPSANVRHRAEYVG
jgi:hypothetical protein